MRISIVLAASITILPGMAPPPAHGYSIVLVTDEGCNTCSVSPSPGQPFDLRIVVVPSGVLTDCVPPPCWPNEIAFRIVGLPADWQVQWTANATAYSATDPFDPNGAVIRFPEVASQSIDCLELYRCVVTPTATPGTSVQVLGNRDVPCSTMPPVPDAPETRRCSGVPGSEAWCSEPGCAFGGTARIDGTPCTVAVLPATWSLVRQLYR